MTRRRRLVRGTTACNPAHIIKHSPQTEIIRHHKGDTPDIIETILWMDAHADRWINPDGVECLRADTDMETLHNVWAFVKRNLTYRADTPGHERVKSPGALYTSGTGDCKSFSIAEGALLRALGYRYRYRFTAYEPGDYTHVYVVATLPDGTDVPMDAVPRTTFGKEVPYHKKKDIRPAGSAAALGAIPTPPPVRQRVTPWGIWIAAGLAIFILLK